MEGLIHGGAYFRNFTYPRALKKSNKSNDKNQFFSANLSQTLNFNLLELEQKKEYFHKNVFRLGYNIQNIYYNIQNISPF